MIPPLFERFSHKRACLTEIVDIVEHHSPRRVGRVVMQRIANPCTPVRFRYPPPTKSSTYSLFSSQFSHTQSIHSFLCMFEQNHSVEHSDFSCSVFQQFLLARHFSAVCQQRFWKLSNRCCKVSFSFETFDRTLGL